MATVTQIQDWNDPEMVDSRSLASTASRLFGVAWRSFLSVVLATFVMGIVLGVASYFYLREHTWLGPVVGLLTVAESLAAGIVLGCKYGFVMALIQGLRDFRVGGTMVRVVFERLLQVDANQEIGERGSRIVQSLERIPLAQAERSLRLVITNAVNAPSSAGGATGWFQRLLQSKLLGAVERYTLERFRDEDAKHGGVNLVKVQTHLESEVDELLVAKLKTGVRLWTLAVWIGLPVTIVGQAWAALALSK